MKSRLILILALIVLLFIVPWRHNIDNTYQGLEYRVGYPDYLERNLNITVKGVYKDYLFKKDTFEGIISIDKYDFTQNTKMSKLTFFDGKATISYFNLQHLGFIICEKDFSKFFIGVDEATGWNGGEGLIITAPATTREEAIKMTKELSKKSEWLSNSIFLEKELSK